MMMSINVNGSDAMQQNISNLTDVIKAKVAEAIANVGYEIENKAKHNLAGHTDTGTLRRSITTQTETTEDTASAVIGSNLEYAPYVHEGTGIYSRSGSGRQLVPWVYYSDKLGHFVQTCGIEPTPFLEDAINAVVPNLTSYFMEIFTDG